MWPRLTLLVPHTGFLNSYFDSWYTSPPVSRLPFGYNALRTLHWMTAKRAPGYWDAVQPLKIIHYCSTPKPWDTSSSNKAGDSTTAVAAAGATKTSAAGVGAPAGAGEREPGLAPQPPPAPAATAVPRNDARRMGDLEMLWWQAFLQAQLAGNR